LAIIKKVHLSPIFMKTLFPIITIFCAFICCNGIGSKEAGKETPKTDSVKSAVKTETNTPQAPKTLNQTFGPFNPDNQFNNITAVLSGLKGQAHKLNYLFDSLAWSENQEFIDESWKKLERKRLKGMRDWAAKEFVKPNAEAKVVFYPFSGPDYLTADAFFPNADKYIMLGLEPVGKLPDLKKFKKGEHIEYVNDFKESLGDIFDKSYFITRKMLHDFGSNKVNGLLPVLTFFIRKTGHEIADVKYLYRFKQDSIIERPYDVQMMDRENPKDKKKPFGVRIDFVKGDKQKSVYYFKYDVSNKFFNDTCAFYKYIDQDKNVVTYIKSASYLLHNFFMSNMRDLILKNSKWIIQDDTGMPFKFFVEKNEWDVKLYGQYARPVSDFKWLTLQKPLQDAFKKDSASIHDLPFHLGYHWGSKKDVIIYASKK
jgi:hypothetical protein